MIDEAIDLIKKQRDMYIIQDNNIITMARKKNVENKVKRKLRKEIQIRDYIIKVLEEIKEERKK